MSAMRPTVVTQVISSLIPLSLLFSSACGVTRQTKRCFRFSNAEHPMSWDFFRHKAAQVVEASCVTVR